MGVSPTHCCNAQPVPALRASNLCSIDNNAIGTNEPMTNEPVNQNTWVIMGVFKKSFLSHTIY
uniref:hypothetical protein n=1 Tax=uncultured Mucilaginibacter sp. TaxID=797541 RepID=UPI0026007D69